MHESTAERVTQPRLPESAGHEYLFAAAYRIARAIAPRYSVEARCDDGEWWMRIGRPGGEPLAEIRDVVSGGGREPFPRMDTVEVSETGWEIRFLTAHGMALHLSGTAEGGGVWVDLTLPGHDVQAARHCAIRLAGEPELDVIADRSALSTDEDGTIVVASEGLWERKETDAPLAGGYVCARAFLRVGEGHEDTGRA